jgi:membrane protease YdiL (CAAX protease family)
VTDIQEPFGHIPVADEVAYTHRWKGRDLAFFGGIFFFLLVIASVVQSIAAPYLQGPTAEVLFALLVSLAVEVALLASTWFLIRWVYGLSFVNEMRLSRDYRISHRSLVFIGLGLGLSVILVTAVISTLYPSLLTDEPTPLGQLLSTPETVAIFGIFGILLAPAVEELMFRGFLFRVLEDLIGVQVAVWTTAAIFAVAHGAQLWPNWPAIIVILAVGCVLSKLRERTRSVVPGFIVHTVYNAVLFLLFALANYASASPV